MKNCLLCLFALLSFAAQAADFDYQLQPREVAPGVHVFLGRTEDFNTGNGGNIVNTGFIVAPQGVVVIDTGPSLRYGQQMRAAIARITDKPILLVINTHHHPDHFLGNQAFADVPIGALPEVRKGIADEGNAFAENLYRMTGDWMSGTEALVPSRSLQAGVLEVGGRRLRLLALDGHTSADLAILDEESGVLFAGDLAFNGRAPTTPHARVDRWLRALASLEALQEKGEARVLVPGHGEVARDAKPISLTREWLVWLDASLRDAAARGLDMNEVLALPLPARFSEWPVAASEYRRSVGHLLPGVETEVLDGAGRP